MKKIFNGLLTFITMLLITKNGTLMTTTEFIIDIFTSPMGYVNFLLPGLLTWYVVRKTNNTLKVSIVNMIWIVVCVVIVFVNFNTDFEIVKERDNNTSTKLYIDSKISSPKSEN